MKCSACGSESNADARFCANCGARLHPEEDTLFRHTNPPGAPGTAAPPPAAAVGPSQQAPRAVGWLVLVVALIAVGYVTYRQLLPDATLAGPTTTLVVPSAPPASTPAPQAPEAKSEPAPPPAAAPPTISAAPAPTVTPPAPAPPKQSTARPRSAKPPPSPPPQVVAAAPPAPPAPAPIAVEPPKPDRFQQLGDALARCRGRDLIGRAVCEQRARLQYCDGYWDQAPQCSGAGKLNPAGN